MLTVICEMMMDSEKRLVCATQAEPNHGEKEKYLSFAPFAPSLARSTYRASLNNGMKGVVRVFRHPVAPILNCIVRDSHNFQIILFGQLCTRDDVVAALI